MPIHSIATQVSDLLDSLKSNEKIEFFDWLSEVQYMKHHRTKVHLLLPGSCQWLFEKPVFKEWAKSNASSILWLHGIPGSGKTMLSCSLIERLSSIFNDATQRPSFAYFYCSRDTADPNRADANELLRTILEQLTCSDIDGPIRRLLCWPIVKAKGRLEDVNLRS